VIAALSAAIIGGLYFFLSTAPTASGSAHHAGSRHGPGHGHPVPSVHTVVFAIVPDGGGQRRPVRTAGRHQSRHGPRLGAQGFHRRGGRRMGNLGGSIAASILVSLLEAYAVILVGYIYVGGQPLSPALAVVVPFHRPDRHLAVPAHRLFVPTPNEQTLQHHLLDRLLDRDRRAGRRAAGATRILAPLPSPRS